MFSDVSNNHFVIMNILCNNYYEINIYFIPITINVTRSSVIVNAVITNKFYTLRVALQFILIKTCTVKDKKTLHVSCILV